MELIELGSILTMTKGKKPLVQSPDCKEGMLPYVDIEAFEKGTIQNYTDGQKCLPCEEGDILIVCDGSRSGLVGRAKKGYVGSTLAKISAEGVINEYLYYFIQGKYALLNTNKKGTGTPHLKPELLKKQKLVVPSIDEQRVIVKKIEELLSEIDNGEDTLKETKELVKIYRQSVLKNAFTGIEAEKKTVKDVCIDIKVGIVIKPSQYYTDEANGVKAFRSANVREFHIDDFDWVYLNKEGQENNRRSELHVGDILVVRTGYPGTACVVTEKFEGCNAIDVLIACPNKDLILPEYLCAFTNSPLGKAFVEEKKRGVGQKHFNVGGYSKMILPIPTMDIQRQVVMDIENKLSVCDSIERTIDAAMQEVVALRQSVLKKAFEGRLV